MVFKQGVALNFTKFAFEVTVKFTMTFPAAHEILSDAFKQINGAYYVSNL